MMDFVNPLVQVLCVQRSVNEVEEEIFTQHHKDELEEEGLVIRKRIKPDITAVWDSRKILERGDSHANAEVVGKQKSQALLQHLLKASFVNLPWPGVLKAPVFVKPFKLKVVERYVDHCVIEKHYPRRAERNNRPELLF